jgi:hypothetical protein
LPLDLRISWRKAASLGGLFLCPGGLFGGEPAEVARLSRAERVPFRQDSLGQIPFALSSFDSAGVDRQ